MNIAVISKRVKKAPILVDLKDPRIGFGVFAFKDIRKGDFIGNYAGELTTLTNGNDTYAFQSFILTHKGSDILVDINKLDPSTQCDPYFVDALRCGNETRFINDAGDNANCVADTLYGKDGIPHVYIVASKDIPAGKELSLNYGPLYWNQAGKKRINLE